MEIKPEWLRLSEAAYHKTVGGVVQGRPMKNALEAVAPLIAAEARREALEEAAATCSDGAALQAKNGNEAVALGHRMSVGRIRRTMAKP